MRKNNLSPFILHPSCPRSQAREWLILTLFGFLTLVMLFPLSVNLFNMVPEPTDPLLNVWRMQWNARAFLSGPAGIANLFDTNIFYPFPLTLAYSEHFLMPAALALPFLLVADSHLFGMNFSVLLTFILSGYAMYLLVSAWTGNRWAGFVAGTLFVFSPHRFGQLNHLELLVTQWMPLTLLALHWTLTRSGPRYPLLLTLFFTLQALSGFHFAFNLAIAGALLTLVYALTRRVYWRRGLWIAALFSVAAILLFNWPVWRMYLRFSDVMGAIRTPGEVRVYSAALTDYFTALPHNLLYGWTFGRWQAEGHQFQPLMPVGLVGAALALGGWLFQISKFKLQRLPFQNPKSSTSYGLPSAIFLFLLTLVGFILSFGLNENALGSGLASLLKYSPYPWLYEHVSIFQGIRVPGRFGILVVIGLTGLAGWGIVVLFQISKFQVSSSAKNWGAGLMLVMLILLESWSAPLVGPEFPAGRDIAPVYHWLQQETPAETVILELPFQGASEFVYEYYSSYHWRRLANGGTGFTPPIYKELRQWFTAFPEARSMDVIQQLGIDLVILHAAAYEPQAWQRVLSDLPRYLPAIEQIHQIGDDMILRIATPTCQAEADLIEVALNSNVTLDGLPGAVEVTYLNRGPAAFVADVEQVSHLIFDGEAIKNFTEPLVTPAGETQAVIVPLAADQIDRRLSGAWLAALDRVISGADLPSSLLLEEDSSATWQPLGLNFADGPQLVAYRLSPALPRACGYLTAALKWTGGQTGDIAGIQLLDPFGRVVIEDTAQPWAGAGEDILDVRQIPLVGALPPGRYGLRVYVQTATGEERRPATDIPTAQIPPLPVAIHPPLAASPAETTEVAALIGDQVRLLAVELKQTTVSTGDWLRFSLIWQTDTSLETDFTVFTQLLGPTGQVWGQQDHQPKGGWYQTTLWPPRQRLVDDYAFQVDPTAPPGLYRLLVGMYHPETLERVPVQTPSGKTLDFVEVGTVQVTESTSRAGQR